MHSNIPAAITRLICQNEKVRKYSLRIIGEKRTPLVGVVYGAIGYADYVQSLAECFQAWAEALPVTMSFG